MIEPDLADHAEAVVREAVSNAVRHGDATAVSVTVTVDDDLRIEVADNGKGLAEGITESGLANLRRRAADGGGEMTVEPARDGGTVLQCRDLLAVVVLPGACQMVCVRCGAPD